jgi:hypothetical protein
MLLCTFLNLDVLSENLVPTAESLKITASQKREHTTETYISSLHVEHHNERPIYNLELS